MDLRAAGEARPENAFEAEVVESVFLGELEQVTLRWQGHELKALQVPRADRVWKSGERVWAGFSAESCSVFAAE